MDSFTTPDGYSYLVDEYGVIHQLEPSKFEYDPAYISTYDHGRYARQGHALNSLRTSLILEMYCRIFSEMPRTVLDFGCGNGAFGKVAGAIFDSCFGFDVIDYPLPEEMKRVDSLIPADIYTFWDSLEHCPDIDFVESIECKMVAISLPLCHFDSLEWFAEWRHRKPNEHLHHFSSETLMSFMNSKGWKPYYTSNLEDVVRTPNDDKQNILTIIFYKNGKP